MSNPHVRPSREFHKTVVVLGGSYGGMRAAQILAAGLPDTVRVILIDRNSHANHLYVFPRYAVLPGHEHKAFIPYTNIFSCPVTPSRIFLHAEILALTLNSVTLSRTFPENDISSPTIDFDYAIYALGAHLPEPLDLWRSENGAKNSSGVPKMAGSKSEGIQWLMASQEKVKRASNVLVVGGGALGIQFATDIAAVYPTKSVTILHSRPRLLPKFDESMHTEILASLLSLGVHVILGERLELASAQGERVMRTTSGREINADLVLFCTGQTSNTDLLATVAPEVIEPVTKEAHVLRTLQLAPLVPSPSDCSKAFDKLTISEGVSAPGEAISEESPTTPYLHLFVIGDAANAFGAIKAGHTAYFQAEVAARNIIRLIKKHCGAQGYTTTPNGVLFDSEEAADADFALEHYTPHAPAIKVSLGLKRFVYQQGALIGTSDAGVEDLDAHRIWSMVGADTTDMTL